MQSGNVDQAYKVRDLREKLYEGVGDNVFYYLKAFHWFIDEWTKKGKNKEKTEILIEDIPREHKEVIAKLFKKEGT